MKALITGASRGFGAAAATVLARRGAHVFLLARTVGGLEETADAVAAAGGTATLVPLDLADAAAAGQLGAGLAGRTATLDIWVHAAVHSGPLCPAADIRARDFDATWAVLVTSTQRLIAGLAPLLGTDGRAVFLDDPVAGRAFYGTYGTAKAAQIALARSWAAETGRLGPGVSVLTPAPMATALRNRFVPGDRGAAQPLDEAERLLAPLL